MAVVDSEERSQRAEAVAADDLPALVARLGDDMVTLLDSKLSLLRVEIKEDIAAYLRASSLLAVSAVVALIGCALVAMTIALLIASLFESAAMAQPIQYAIGTGIAGVLLIAGGLLAVRRTIRGFRRIEPLLEKSVGDLQKDKQWLGQ